MARVRLRIKNLLQTIYLHDLPLPQHTSSFGRSLPKPTQHLDWSIWRIRNSVSSIKRVPTSNTPYSMWYCSNGLCILQVNVSFTFSSWGYLTITNNEQIAKKYRPNTYMAFPTSITNKSKDNLGDIILEVFADGTAKLTQKGGQWLNTTEECMVTALGVWPCAAQVS